MKYKYSAITEITLGGIVYLSGSKLPDGYDYQSLYDVGMVARVKILEDSPDKEVITIPRAIEVKTKVKKHGKKRNNKSNRQRF